MAFYFSSVLSNTVLSDRTGLDRLFTFSLPEQKAGYRMQVLGHYREHQQYITATGLLPSSEMETGYGVQIPG